MSRTVLVRYRVRAEAVAQNLEMVRAVYKELSVANPEGLRYSTYRMDGQSFLHVAVIDGPGNPLDDVTAFRTFSAGIAERCEEGPEVVEGEIVGSYPTA